MADAVHPLLCTVSFLWDRLGPLKKKKESGDYFGLQSNFDLHEGKSRGHGCSQRCSGTEKTYEVVRTGPRKGGPSTQQTVHPGSCTFSPPLAIAINDLEQQKQVPQ